MDFSMANRFSWQAWDKMVDLVTNLLMLHNAPRLDAFRFAIDGGISADRLPAVDGWVRRGIMCSPSVLDIEIFNTGEPGLFEEISSFELPSIESASCRLKRLTLVGVSLGTSFAEQLRSGCPVLEDVHLEDCCTEFNAIQSHTLKKLSLFFCYRRHSVDTLAIRAPALATLALDLNTPEHGEKKEVSVDGLSNSLVKAWIFYPHDMAPRSRVMLLGSLSNVTKLELTGCFSTEVCIYVPFSRSQAY
jgi:hypothetical protein